MNRRARARALLLLLAMSLAETVHAGAWHSEPVLGLETDYSNNPQLTTLGQSSATDGAVVIDVPTTYSASAWNFSLEPSFRFTDNSGYSSLLSKYSHLTASGEFDDDRNTIKATTLLERDSSLYQNYNLNGSTGVRQDTGIADITWARALSERMTLSTDVNYSHVRYGSSNGQATLTDYSYSSASPTLTWSATERTSLTAVGGFSLYQSLDGRTRSTDGNLEFGFNRKLTELWTATAKGGLSRESNTIEQYFGPFLLGTYRSHTNGTVFSGSLTRAGERLTTTLEASRTLAPSGFAFLSRRDLYAVSANYLYSERWTVSGYLRRRNEQDPQFFVPTQNRRYTDLGLSATWRVTPQWTMTATAAHVAAVYGPPDVSARASSLSLQIARHFNRIDWH